MINRKILENVIHKRVRFTCVCYGERRNMYNREYDDREDFVAIYNIERI